MWLPELPGRPRLWTLARRGAGCCLGSCSEQWVGEQGTFTERLCCACLRGRLLKCHLFHPFLAAVPRGGLCSTLQMSKQRRRAFLTPPSSPGPEPGLELGSHPGRLRPFPKPLAGVLFCLTGGAPSMVPVTHVTTRKGHRVRNQDRPGEWHCQDAACRVGAGPDNTPL